MGAAYYQNIQLEENVGMIGGTLTRKTRPSLESGIKALTSFSIGPLGVANIRKSCHFLILYISAWPVDRWSSHRRNSSRFASAGDSALSTILA